MAHKNADGTVTITRKEVMDESLYFEIKYNHLAQRVNSLVNNGYVSDEVESTLRADLVWEPGSNW